jgi:hypothetical protein
MALARDGKIAPKNGSVAPNTCVSVVIENIDFSYALRQIIA